VPLVEDRYDLAFRVGPIHGRELIARRLWSFEQAFAASPSLVREQLSGRTRIPRSVLEKLPAVMTRPSSRSFRLLRSDGTSEEVPALVRTRVNDPRAAIAAATTGLGVVCTSRDMLAAHGPELITLTIVGLRPPPVDLFAVYPSRALVPARVRAALDWVIAHARTERRLHVEP
jgi:LysR family transcriptional regulator AphB